MDNVVENARISPLGIVTLAGFSFAVVVMKVLNTALPEYAQQDRSTDSAWAQALILAREV